jgi:CheY-like chemotaxis protein
LRQDRVERLRGDEDIGENVGGRGSTAVLLEYKLEGMDAEAVAYQIKQRFPRLPIILLSAYSQMPERILWLVDEYVLKSEPPEGLAQIIERATRPYWLAPRSNDGGKHPSAGHRDASEVVKRQGAVA